VLSVDGIRSFIVEKFWLPIVSESVFYNPYNTAVYAILFGLAVYYIGIPAIRKMDLEVDRKLFLGLTPFVFLGGALRSLKDLNIVDTIALETPLIYFLMFGFVSTVLYLSTRLEELKGVEYWKPMFATGTLSLFTVLGLIPINNPGALGSAALMFSTAAVAVYYGTELFYPELATLKFQLPVIAHYFDATSTVVSLANGGEEKHVLASLFIDNFGPYSMFLMKTLIIVPVTWYVVKETDGDVQRFVLFVIALLGFALGTRNLLATVGVA
jgi:uncharacterized membrane protein